MLRFPLGPLKASVVKSSPLPSMAPLPKAAIPSDVGLISITGTVADPRLQYRKGHLVWQCTLMQTHVGLSAKGGETVDTQLLEVRCIGSWATAAQGIKKGTHISVMGKILHRPKYISSTTSYDYRSEVLVSDISGQLCSL